MKSGWIVAYDNVYSSNMTIAKERARGFCWNFLSCWAEFEMMNNLQQQRVARNGDMGKTTELLQPRTTGGMQEQALNGSLEQWAL